MTKNKSQKRFAPKLKIKKGDRVMVIRGADKGKTGSVLEVIPGKGKVIVEDVNIVKKHMKPTNENAGGIVEVPAPLDISKVMILDPKSGEPTRVGRREENGKLVRYSKKSGEIIK